MEHVQPVPSRVNEKHEDELFFRALDASADAVTLSSVRDGRFIYVNQAFLQATGYAASEVLARTSSDLHLWVDEAERAAVSAMLEDRGSAANLEARFQSRSGQVRFAQVSAELVEIDGQSCVLTMARDITDRRRLEDDLYHLASIVESSQDAIISKALDGTILSWNTGAQRMYGYTAEEAVGQPIDMLAPTDRQDQMDLILDRIRAGQSVTAFETVRIRKDGTPVDVSLMVSPTRDADGKVTGASAIARDITDRKRAEDQLRAAEAKYRSLIERIPLVTYVDAVDRASSTLYMSPQVEGMLGYPPEAWQDEPELWPRLIHPEDRERVIAEHNRTNMTGDPFTIEYRLLHRDGHAVWVRDEALLVRDDQGRPQFWQGMLLDITKRKQAEEEISFLAYHDTLTSLPNRAMFEELLGLALARARRHDRAVAVIYADLDNFKMVNDSLGHSAGDNLLRRVADRMREVSRATDVVARQGGDEFLILLADLVLHPTDGSPGAVEVATSVAERLRRALDAPFALAGTEVSVSASVGISIYPMDARDSAAILANADSAMYQGKRAGRGGQVLYGAGAGGGGGALSFSNRLRKAVERQRWVLHYQPLVDLVQGTVFGVEALIRWQDPRAGLVPPDRFLQVAEEMGLAESIADWLIEEVCRQAAAWKEQGISLLTSFNLSARELWRRDLVARLTRTMESFGLAPEALGVEIAESTAMVDPGRTFQVIGELHERGVRVSIDDFGTGYSSLSGLTQLPVDFLKIDRSFVQRLPDDAGAARIVTAAVDLARTVGMEPLGEGIETDGQWRFLLDRGCRHGQGYRFTRPVAAGEITARARTNSLRFPPLESDQGTLSPAPAAGEPT